MAKRPRLSRLLRDILLVNLLPVALIFVALLYLDQYQQGLLAAEVTALRQQARIYAGALTQSAVQNNAAGQAALDADLAQPLLFQLTEPTPNAQALIYGPDGTLIANSRVHPGANGAIVTTPLEAPPPPGLFNRVVSYLYDNLAGSLTGEADGQVLSAGAGQNPDTLGWQPDAREALQLTDIKPGQETAPSCGATRSTSC